MLGGLPFFEEENLGLLGPVSLSRMNAIFKYENNSIYGDKKFGFSHFQLQKLAFT